MRDHRFDGAHQFLNGDGFTEENVRAGFQRLPHLITRGRTRHDQHGDFGRGWLTTQETHQIEAIEFYSSPAQTPSKYSRLNSRCGVYVIHTRRPPG